MSFSYRPSRRDFLKFLAASPLLTAVGRAQLESDVIKSPEDALNVFDFEAAAKKALAPKPAHFGYIATGVDGDLTIRANREGFQHFGIRPRRLIDTSKVDTTTKIMGTNWGSPIILAPVGSQEAFHEQGEVGSARGAKKGNHLQILSNQTNASVEEVMEARGAPIWFQLYASTSWPVSSAIVKRAEKAGCPVLVYTVDQISGSNRETLRKYTKIDTRDCTECHDNSSLKSRNKRRAMFEGLNLEGVAWQPPTTWEYVKRLKETTSMKIVIKGILTKEDAQLAVSHGVDGVVCSNHGGRGDEVLTSSIECLPEVIEGAAGRIPVLVDSGFRRGTDIFTALALGAAGVAIGRPYIWGLSAFGPEGVAAVLDVLSRELKTTMRYAGTPKITDITKAHVVAKGR